MKITYKQKNRECKFENTGLWNYFKFNDHLYQSIPLAVLKDAMIQVNAIDVTDECFKYFNPGIMVTPVSVEIIVEE